jgi:hypothetical protein
VIERKERDPREPGDPRDERDARQVGDPRDPIDPRDERDERRAEDPRDERDARAERREIAAVKKIADSHGALRLTVLVVVLFLVDFFWSSHTATVAADGQAKAQRAAIAAEDKAISAGCSFWQPLVSLPVTIVAPANKPSKVGVQILAGARIGYVGQCHPPEWPPMSPADPSLVKWAKIYHIPLR